MQGMVHFLNKNYPIGWRHCLVFETNVPDH